MALVAAPFLYLRRIASWSERESNLVFLPPHIFPRLIQYLASEFGITNKRIIVKRGIKHRKSLELFLKRIEGV